MRSCHDALERGDQVRPNIHIQDITDVYCYLITRGDQLEGVYNAGFENLSILEIAQRVAQRIPAEIRVVESQDPRSYRVNSDKLLATGYRPQKTVDDAIDELVTAYRDGHLVEHDRFHNLRWMQRSLSEPAVA